MTAQTPVTPEISLVEAVWRYRLMSLIIVLASVLASVAATQILFSGATATAMFAVTDRAALRTCALSTKRSSLGNRVATS